MGLHGYNYIQTVMFTTIPSLLVGQIILLTKQPLNFYILIDILLRVKSNNTIVYIVFKLCSHDMILFKIKR